jgi:hypothetical protein
MKKHLLIQSLVLALPVLGLTSIASANSSLPQLNNVYVPVHRVLESSEQRYLLQVTTGIWNPQATLFDRINNTTTYFNGEQKGNSLSLYSVNQLNNGKETATHIIDAAINLTSGALRSEIISNSTQKTVHFQPLVKLESRPSFSFKFYGGATIQEVQVTNRNNQKIVQRLTGFNASPERMDYMDINFDGYYDLVFVNARAADHYIYWMYNPKTAQFQRAPQLDKLAGQPKIDGIKKEISFGEQRFKVENGILSPFMF